MITAPQTIPSTQPKDVVTFAILIDNGKIPDDIPVTSISIHKEINKIPFAKIKIADGDPAARDFVVSNEEYFIPGKKIEIKLGWRNDITSLFKGIIVAHSNKISSNNAELIVECKDKAVKMTVGKRSKHYENVKDSDIAEEIIGRYSLDLNMKPTSILHKQVVQYATTDWDFIISRIDMIGRICVVNDGEITIKKPNVKAPPVLDLLFGATILEYSAEIDSRTQFSEISSKAWDYSSQEITEDTGDDPRAKNAGNLSYGDLADVVGLDTLLLMHSGNLTSEMVKEWASARMLKSRLGKIKGKVKFQGFPGVKPGDFISLNGVGDRFNGPVFVTAVTQDFSGGDWTTEVNFGMSDKWFAETINPHHPSSQLGQIPSVQGLQIGIVTDLEDPDGEFRVKVRLPIVSTQEEGIWMRIATLDAGNNRGTFFLPELNDEVIVGFINNDPDYAVILGMLNSSALPAPLTASASNAEKGYVSREGIKMIFDDEKKSYTLETPGGKKITLNDEDGVVTIEDENGNKITMDSSAVTVESAADLIFKAAGDITMEGVNIKLTPSAEFSVSAGGCEVKAGSGSASLAAPTVKLDGSGITEIKGGLVKIN